MLKAALVGAGKMGLSHLAILGAHPELDVVAVCDATGYILTGLRKHTGVATYKNVKKLLEKEELDVLVVATPTATHFETAKAALERGVAVFMEKPLSLDPEQSRALVAMAKQAGKPCQVGYHNRFLGTFREAKRLIEHGALGRVHHVAGTAFGPVVVRKKASSTWRSKKSEGGGCLHDYASHVIDLMNFIVGDPVEVSYAHCAKVFSAAVEDVVRATFRYEAGFDGRLEANWSDPCQRKMSTTVSIWGDNGRVVVDRQECQAFLVAPCAAAGYGEGYTTRYITDLQEPVNYYLRGEEYSAQIDAFVRAVRDNDLDGENSFASACRTDELIDEIARKSGGVV